MYHKITIFRFHEQLALESINAIHFASYFPLGIPRVCEGCNFTIGRFHIETVRKRRNKTHLIFARSPSSVPRRLLVPCASRVGSPKISIRCTSRTRAHLVRHLHVDETRRQRRNLLDASFFFASRNVA